MNYLLLAVVYIPIVWYRGELFVVFRSWWRLFALLAFFDVEANYLGEQKKKKKANCYFLLLLFSLLVVLAYSYTPISSVALLSGFSIVVCVLGMPS